MPGPQHSPEALLRRLEWTVLRRLDGLLQGNYRTLFRGLGLDLADLREYQYHDDVRYIDWNVTARLQTPYVREYFEDREVTAWFLVDLSASMDFGARGELKRGVAREFTGVLARLLTRHGNRVGALLYGNQIDTVIPAGGGRRHVLRILDRMSARAAPGNAAATDLESFLKGAIQYIPRRSLVFVVSDFISAPGWERALSQLVQRHEVLAVRVYDPLEFELPDLGLIVMTDAETGEQVFVDTHDPGFRRRFVEVAERREQELRAGLRKAAVDTLELSTEGELLDAILRFSGLRRQRSRRSGGVPAGVRSRSSSEISVA
ncbi:MAG TPA: DUF58 domain-containing protein [Burkholderiaceae bacterium]